jgi:hypothetical protein
MLMNLLKPVAVLCLLGWIHAPAFAQDGVFEVLKGDEVIGRIQVGRTVHGERTSYSMTSVSAFSIIWMQNVRSSVVTEYLGGRVNACRTTMHVNDEMRDSSHMLTVDGRALCYVHPEAYFVGNTSNPWTTARMYYEEPKGQKTIFVESALRDCPLVCTGEGRYSLTLPNKDSNHYVYRQGKLQQVIADRTWFDLVFRRV